MVLNSTSLSPFPSPTRAGAAFCVSPFITIVDRSIIMNASGAKPLGQALKDGVKVRVWRCLSAGRAILCAHMKGEVSVPKEIGLWGCKAGHVCIRHAFLSCRMCGFVPKWVDS